MGLRPWKCYRGDMHKPAYTRVASRKQKKNFIRGAPGIKIRLFNMGQIHNPYERKVDLLCTESILIRQEALEAARMACNRPLAKDIGKGNYYVKLNIYPHHILRENKMLTGAGADRMQTGMSQAFGKKTGRACRVRAPQAVFTFKIFEKDVTLTKRALKLAQDKLPGKYKIVVSELDPSKYVAPKRKKEGKEEIIEEKVVVATEEKTDEKKGKGNKEDAKKKSKKK